MAPFGTLKDQLKGILQASGQPEPSDSSSSSSESSGETETRFQKLEESVHRIEELLAKLVDKLDQKVPAEEMEPLEDSDQNLRAEAHS
jgi:hypothetical protein